MTSFAKIKRKHLVKSRLPSFIVNEHETFVKFLEVYYDFLSQKQFVTSESFMNYLDIDTVPQEFLDYFWEEVKEIPNTIMVDKRLLATHIRDLYASKGTPKSIQLLFRILYNESIEVKTPKTDMLRVSDGKWTTINVIRVEYPGDEFDTSSLNGKTITQYDTYGNKLATCVVENIQLVFKTKKYMYVYVSNIKGTFEKNYPLYNSTKTIVLNVVPTFKVESFIDRGALFENGDFMQSQSGSLLYVDSVGSGPVEDILIIDGGTGYSEGDFLTVDNGASGGMGLSAYVKSVDSSGSVRAIRIISQGRGYETLPTVTGNGTGKFIPVSSKIGRILSFSIKEPSDDNTQINMAVRAIVDSTVGFIHGEQIERVTDFLIAENGDVLITEDGQLISPESNPITNTTIGTIREIIDGNRLLIGDNYGASNLITEDGIQMVTEDGQPMVSELYTYELGRYRIRGVTSGAEANILFVRPFNVTTTMSPIYNLSSKFNGDDGFISQSNKRIQDSLFYQDFSYVIQSSQSFDLYKNALYKLVHPAGMAAFGEVHLENAIFDVNNRVKQAFDVLKIIARTLLDAKISVAQNVESIRSEVRIANGPSWEWIENNKLLISRDYTSGTFGSEITTKQFYRPDFPMDVGDTWKVGNTPSSLITKFTADDMFEYPNGYGSYTTTVRLKRNKRLPYCLDSYITKAPAFPLEDEVIVTDAISFTLTSVQADSVSLSDTFSVSFDMKTADTFTADDVLSWARDIPVTATDSVTASDSIAIDSSVSLLNISTVTATDSIAQIGLSGMDEHMTTSDEVSVITISTPQQLNGASINTGAI